MPAAILCIAPMASGTMTFSSANRTMTLLRSIGCPLSTDAIDFDEIVFHSLTSVFNRSILCRLPPRGSASPRIHEYTVGRETRRTAESSEMLNASPSCSLVSTTVTAVGASSSSSEESLRLWGAYLIWHVAPVGSARPPIEDGRVWLERMPPVPASITSPMNAVAANGRHRPVAAVCGEPAPVYSTTSVNRSW